MLHVQSQTIETALDPVTVVSSLSKLSSSKTGRNIFVLQGKDIAALPVKSLDELLRYIPGIEVQSRGAMGAQSDITIRGGTFEQVLVIVDGVRLNDPNTGHFTGYIPVALDEIEEIEVLRGASSAVYGSDAVGGVINITTKVFTRNHQQKNEADAMLAGGAFGTINASGSYLLSNEKSSVQLSAQTNNTDGQQQRGISGYVHNNLFAASFSQKLNDRWNLAFRTSYDSRNFAAQNFYTNYVSDTAKEKVQAFFNQLHLSYQKNKNSFSLLAGYKNTYDHYAFNSTSSANNNYSNLYQATALYEYSFAKASVFTGGLQYVGRNINSNDRGNHTVNQLAAFAVLLQPLAKDFLMNASLRYDWNEISGGTIVPQLNLSYRIKNVQLRGSIGNTIRYADFTELYNNYNETSVTGGSIGNPNLDPEKTFNYEAGIDWFVKQKFKISFDIFQRQCHDLIDWANTAYADMPRKINLVPGGNYLLAKNVSQVTTSGAELDVQLIQPLSNNKTISANAGFIWMDSQSDNGTLTLYVSSHAKFLSNFNIKYSTKKFGISVNGIYKIRTPRTGTLVIMGVSENYFVVNTKIEAYILPKVLTVFIQADNVFNSTYSDFIGTPMPNRWILGGVKFLFR